MPNIRDVAKEAGVSISAVSRILSGDETFKVTNATRAAVMAAIEKLGYQVRSPQKAKKDIRIGCILALSAEKYGDPFFSSILAAAEEECNRQGVSLSLIRNYAEITDVNELHKMFSENLSGLLLMEGLPDQILEQVRSKVPHILSIDTVDSNFIFDGVGFDHRVAARQAMRCLLRHGYRRIAIIAGSSLGESFPDSYRLQVYREELRRAGIPFDESLVYDCGWDLDLCASQAKALMALENPPDAIFAGSDSLASVILGALYPMGIRCPEDIGVIGFNNIPLSAHMIPPLTTINIPTQDIGIAAVKRLMEMISGNSGAIRRILFSTELVERNSLRDVNKDEVLSRN